MLRAFAALPLTPDQKSQVIQALSGYVPDQPPNALQNLLIAAANYLDNGLAKRDAFLVAALQGLMEKTEP